MPGVPVGGGFKSIGRELKRAGRRVGAEAGRAVDRVSNEVARGVDRLGSEAGRFTSRVTKEYGRLGSRLSSEAKRASGKVGSVYSGAFDLVKDAGSKLTQTVKENPAAVAALGGLLLPFGGVWAIAGTVLGAWSALSMTGGSIPGLDVAMPWQEGFGGGSGATLRSGSSSMVSNGWLIAAAVVLLLLWRFKR